MLTQEEGDGIRAQIIAEYDIEYENAATLLDTLDAETKRADEAISLTFEKGDVIIEMARDRDQWKARAETLENDLINANMNLELMTNRAEALERALLHGTPCDICSADDSACNYCESVDGYPCWIFNEACLTEERSNTP